ncbi:Burnettramic acids biosynthesis cluster protein E [Pseudocercospora fuligena]|uniref:Burnettramic acids biosynthesis cluster protein E n=1 Tax=Pseudocercospora fuligena TaxID=685502 RepID=A0A8H6RHP5_9PEZI|nr:Burnettramic acids biosynthesis cluster protein E [Pseudocercospora fuligena]
MGDRQRTGLFGLISSGIGMAAEYNEHRKEQKQARAAAAEEQTSLPTADSTGRVEAPPTDLPPAYADATRSSDRTLEAGPSASDEKRRSIGPNDLTDPESFSSDDESTEDDEEMWELDDAITPEDSKAGLPSYEESEATKQLEPTEDLVRDVMGTSAAHKVAQPSSSRPQKPLPCPVIIPQRRPRKKSRGFVRAYAPVLQNAGIDQDTFLAFLKNFHKSSQAHPILPIIQVAAGIAGFAPGVIAMAVTTGVQIGAKVAAETQERYKTNTFLDKMNQELFQPAGVYAMIVKYKSDAEMEESARRTGLISSLIKPQTVDLSTNQVIAKYSGEDSNGGMSSRMQNLRLSSTTSSGQLSLPECAPLVFPAIDEKYSANTGSETFKDKTKDAQRFLSDYLDRRAQMQYAAQGSNPEQLTVPQGERGFRSSLADPNHAMHSGGLVALGLDMDVEALGEAEEDLDVAEVALMASHVAVEVLEVPAAMAVMIAMAGAELLMTNQSMVMILQGQARLLEQMRMNGGPGGEGGTGDTGVAVVPYGLSREVCVRTYCT